MTTAIAPKLNPDVAAFLAQDPIPLFIDGRWVLPASGETLPVEDPATGEAVTRIALAGEKEVDLACRAAQKAFETSGWATMPVKERSAILRRLADLIEANLDSFAQIEALDVGKTFAAAKGGDIPSTIAALRYFADVAEGYQNYSRTLKIEGMDARYIRVPFGVTGFIFPWNFPFLLLGWGIAPALAAGNTVVIKQSEVTPLSTLFFCKLLKEAGIPDGVVNVVSGMGSTAGKALTNHPLIRRMSFTGSPEVGRLIAADCGRNLIPVKLELGGKGAAVVFDDVDAKDTGRKLAGAITLNSGQVCCTATRWIIHEKIFDEVISEAMKALTETRIGHGLADGVDMGPVVSDKQRQRILGYLQRGVQSNGKALLECQPLAPEGLEKGHFVSPSLLTGSADNVCFREEIFGPTAFAIPFKGGEKEALDLVHTTLYGLANSVWSGDLERANRVASRMVVGNSWINAHNVFAYGLPYGGVNLSGMGGGVNSPETFEDYLRGQTVARPL